MIPLFTAANMSPRVEQYAAKVILETVQREGHVAILPPTMQFREYQPPKGERSSAILDRVKKRRERVVELKAMGLTAVEMAEKLTIETGHHVSDNMIHDDVAKLGLSGKVPRR